MGSTPVRLLRHRAVYNRLQAEAAARPGSRAVPTAYGRIWMSPIEAQLFDALARKGLAPVPQYCIKGYFVDFAFPALALAVEADGSILANSLVTQRDHRRDWILRRSGWTVMRFHGSAILHRSENCAFVVEREVRVRQLRPEQLAALELRRRQARRETFRHPFQTPWNLIFVRNTRGTTDDSTRRPPTN